MCPGGSPAADRPNILWITNEDTGPLLGCYGDKFATTPHLDKLASRSLLLNTLVESAELRPAQHAADLQQAMR